MSIQTSVPIKKVVDTIWHEWDTPHDEVYAVLDSAHDQGIYELLNRSDAISQCLFSGKLSPRLARAAPWLLRLRKDEPLTERVIREGWGQSWGMYLRIREPMEAVRKHLRTFLKVKYRRKNLYFRYYDPRVLRAYLPTCHLEELSTIFGSIESFFYEESGGGAILQARIENGQLQTKRMEL